MPLFTGFFTSQVVQDFFHQQYVQYNYRGLCNHVGLLYHCILYHHTRDNGDTKELRSPLFQMPLSIGFATWAFCRLWRRTTSDGANRLLTHRNCLTRPYLIKNIKHKNCVFHAKGVALKRIEHQYCLVK